MDASVSSPFSTPSLSARARWLCESSRLSDHPTTCRRRRAGRCRIGGTSLLFFAILSTKSYSLTLHRCSSSLPFRVHALIRWFLRWGAVLVIPSLQLPTALPIHRSVSTRKLECPLYLRFRIIRCFSSAILQSLLLSCAQDEPPSFQAPNSTLTFSTRILRNLFSSLTLNGSESQRSGPSPFSIGSPRYYR